MFSFHIRHRVHLPIDVEASTRYHVGLSSVSACILSYKATAASSLSHLLAELDAIWNGDIVPTEEQIETFITHLKDVEASLEIGFAAIFFTDEKAHLYTLGGGMLLSRKAPPISIIEGEHTAEGTVSDDDEFVLIPHSGKNTAFLNFYNAQEVSGGLLEDSTDVFHQEPHLIVSRAQGEDPETLIATEVDELTPAEDLGLNHTNSIGLLLARWFQKRPSFSPDIFRRKKSVLYLVTVVLAIIFIWSVLLGSSRRKEELFVRASQQAAQEIRGLIKEAKDVAPFDPTSAGDLLTEARTKLKSLEDQAAALKIDAPKDLLAIKAEIESSSNTMFKKSSAQAEEFFLFSLIGSQTKISRARLIDDSILLLDAKNKSAYAISIDEKAVTTYTSPLLGEAKSITLSKKELYFLVPQKGVYVIDGAGHTSSKPVIAPDGWVKPTEVLAFGGNIYLLDGASPYIFKYVPIEEGFSSSKEYLHDPTSQKLMEPTHIAIDGAVYIANSVGASKYISGVKDSFSLKAPDSYGIDGFAISVENDNIAILDKKNSRILLFTKEGEFLKQIVTPKVSEAQDLMIGAQSQIFLQTEKGLYQVTE